MLRRVSIILLVLLSVQLAGWQTIRWLHWQNMQKIVKRYRTAYTEYHDKHLPLTVVAIPIDKTNEVRWIKQHKEFVWQQQWYDVVYIQPCPDEQTTYYYCIHDKKDTYIAQQSEQQQQQPFQQANNTGFSYILQQLLAQVYLTDYQQLTIQPAARWYVILSYGQLPLLCKWFVDVPTQPPQPQQ